MTIDHRGTIEGKGHNGLNAELEQLEEEIDGVLDEIVGIHRDIDRKIAAVDQRVGESPAPVLPDLARTREWNAALAIAAWYRRRACAGRARRREVTIRPRRLDTDGIPTLLCASLLSWRAGAWSPEDRHRRDYMEDKVALDDTLLGISLALAVTYTVVSTVPRSSFALDCLTAAKVSDMPRDCALSICAIPRHCARQISEPNMSGAPDEELTEQEPPDLLDAIGGSSCVLDYRPVNDVEVKELWMHRARLWAHQPRSPLPHVPRTLRRNPEFADVPALQPCDGSTSVASDGCLGSRSSAGFGTPMRSAREIPAMAPCDSFSLMSISNSLFK